MINLQKIFIEQDRLNKDIAKKHVGYSAFSEEGLIRNYCFAALAELGECANEWGHFKIWKSTREENRDAQCKKCGGTGLGNSSDFEPCAYCKAGRVNPLQEEYVDVFHFVVSVAIGFKLDPKVFMDSYEQRVTNKANPTDSYRLYLDLFQYLAYATALIDEFEGYEGIKSMEMANKAERGIISEGLMSTLLDLGYSLGFTDENIEEAYFSKHKINQVRQANNY